MLNKSICHNCYKKFPSVFTRTLSFDEYWKVALSFDEYWDIKKVCVCPALYGVYPNHIGFYTKIEDKPPDNCLYILEQAITHAE